MIYRNIAKIIVKTIKATNMGQLSFFEGNKDIPFDIKRIYYITNVPKGVERGGHAHKHLKQFIFCPFGKIKLSFDDGCKKEEIILDDPSIGVLIVKPLWREMLWLEPNSVLCVAASDYYSEDDYLRDYSSFLEYVGKEKKNNG